MGTIFAEDTVSKSPYFDLIKHMSDDAKLDLILVLTQSLRHENLSTASANDFYGIWADDGVSADEATHELKSMRSFKNRVLPL